MGKTDSTGTYSYICDGTTPGSAVLSDGHALYTPGLSENRGGTSAFYSFDQLGNLWTADGTSRNQLTAVDYSAFGCTLSGSAGTPVGYGGLNGCLTDPDASLVLMGHRYFDLRIGRFISQDPVGSGDNWYAYADNSPTNEVDPTGLTDSAIGTPPGDYTYPDGRPYTVNQDGSISDPSTIVIIPPVFHFSTFLNQALPYVSLFGPAFMTERNDPQRFTSILGYKPAGGPYYRGGTDFTAKRDEVRMTGNKVRPMERGTSLWSNKAKIPSRFVPNKVTNIPDELTIEQRGVNQEHYEVLTKNEMEFERYN